MKPVLFFVLVGLALACTTPAPPKPRDTLDHYLTQGRLDEALEVYRTWPEDPQAGFENGVVTLAAGVRDFVSTAAAFLKKDIPMGAEWMDNLARKPVSYPELMAAFRQLRDRMESAASLLERGGKGAWQVEFHPLLIQLDLNRDGQFTEGERLDQVRGLFPIREGELDPKTFTVKADPADSLWLAGYCRLLGAGLNLVLAYNWDPLYQAFGDLIFEQRTDAAAVPPAWDWSKSRLTAAHKEQGALVKTGLKRVLALSRLTMAALEAETDNDREWIPSARQDSVTGIKIDQERWASWNTALDEADRILDGKLVFDFENSAVRNLGLDLSKILDNLPDLSADLPAYLKDRYLSPVPPAQLLGPGHSLMRFLQGDGLLYAIFIN